MSLLRFLSVKSSHLGFGGQSALLLERDENFYSKCTSLRLIKSVTPMNLNRQWVAATLLQRMVFYHYQVTSPSKSQFVDCDPFLISFWMLLALFAGLSFGGLGSYYIQSFLGLFAREQHLYVSKMVPIAIGINFVYFISAIVDLGRSTDLSLSFLDYIIYGVYNRCPWMRCDAFNYTIPKQNESLENMEFECRNLFPFRDLILTNLSSSYETMRFVDYSCYKFEGYSNCVQVPQIIYMQSRRFSMTDSSYHLPIYLIMLWGGCIVANGQIYRNFIWKLLLVADVGLLIIYATTILHTVSSPEPTIAKYDKKLQHSDQTLWELLQLMSAAFVFSPNMVQFISARSKTIAPSEESFFMTIAILLRTLLKLYTSALVSNYSHSWLGGLQMDSPFITNSHMNIFSWLIYFGTMGPGNFFSLVYLIVSFLNEYVAMVITFNCFVEIFSAEYRWFKRWIAIHAIVLLSLIHYAFWTSERYIIQFYFRVSIMFMEALLIYLFYPLRRLLDDITFYFGRSPSTMRYFTLLMSIVTEFLLLAAIVSYNGYSRIISLMREDYFDYMALYISLIVFVVAPMLIGIAYTAIKYIFIDQKDWTTIFVPVDIWGPSKFLARQLRKDFDSSKYIPSQAPRVLSRYLLKNAEPDKYKLDIVYEFYKLWRVVDSARNSA